MKRMIYLAESCDLSKDGSVYDEHVLAVSFDLNSVIKRLRSEFDHLTDRERARSKFCVNGYMVEVENSQCAEDAYNTWADSLCDWPDANFYEEYSFNDGPAFSSTQSYKDAPSLRILKKCSRTSLSRKVRDDGYLVSFDGELFFLDTGGSDLPADLDGCDESCFDDLCQRYSCSDVHKEDPYEAKNWNWTYWDASAKAVRLDGFFSERG